MEFEGRPIRWNPCEGQVRVGLNHNGYLSATRLGEWETFLRQAVVEIAAFTGLDIVYAGPTGQELQPGRTHPSVRQPIDILFFIAPLETYWSFGHTYYENVLNLSDPRWTSFFLHEIEVDADSVASGLFDFHKRYIMNNLGNSVGLGDLEDGISTEIMSWGSNGSGTSRDPDWGEGDKIAFGLVGASHGCIN